MKSWWSRIGVVVGVVALGISSVASASVICEKKSGALVVREACKKKETPVNLADFGAIGPQGLQGPQGNPGQNGSDGTNGTNAVSLFAGVKSNGTSYVGNATSVTHSGTGSNEVFFGTDVTNCVASVNEGWSFPAIITAGGDGAGLNATFFVRVADAHTNSVTVYSLKGSDGSFFDTPFVLTVQCPIP